uniref:Uncharacterized protein n=1 Tax=Aegilops tauschii subsp. strangulata TaxID=200361 RepID=A0A453M9X7_AEGTS
MKRCILLDLSSTNLSLQSSWIPAPDDAFAWVHNKESYDGYHSYTDNATSILLEQHHRLLSKHTTQ